MVHDLNPKNLKVNGINFFAKSEKPYFWGLFGNYHQNDIFSPKNPAVPVFYP